MDWPEQDDKLIKACQTKIKAYTWKAESQIAEHEFDFINTNQVFELIANPVDVLKYLCGSLKRDGIIKISVPNGHVIKRRLEVMDWEAPKGSKNSLNPVAPLEHINCFNEDSLVYLATSYGLERVDLTKINGAKNSIIDYSLRDIIKPIYQKIMANKLLNRGSTNLFFKKSKNAIN